MNPDPVVSHFIADSRLAPFFLDALLRSLVVLAAAGGLLLIWRRAPAATRHLIWFLALRSLPLLPLLPSISHSWTKPLWSVSADTVSGNEISLRLELAPQAAPANPVPNAAPPPQFAATSVGRTGGTQLIAAHFSSHWLTAGLGIWCGGFLFGLGYVMFGQIQLRKLSREARLLERDEWTRLLEECSGALRLRRRVTLRQSATNVMPLTWSWWRPVVLLPAEADRWPEERRRIVLLHELAHVKRLDCLTQLVARLVCALYWFNPLAWLAAQQMRVERERACDDLVLNGGCRASDYASHLVEIARNFRRVPQVAAIAMARSSGLEKRVAAIVDASRVRALRPAAVWAVFVLAGALIFCIGGWSAESGRTNASGDSALWQRQIEQLKKFSASKLKQSQQLAAANGEEISPEFQRFFDAAISGDSQTVTNMYASFHARHRQYQEAKGNPVDEDRLDTSFWGPVLEICLAYGHVANCDPRYTQIAVDEIVNSIPAGSIYFGGTDPGRGLPTAFSKSHADADPFYTLTQNALADGSYLEYLRNMYGERRHWLIPLGEACRADPALQALRHDYENSSEILMKLLSTYASDDPRCKAAVGTNDILRGKIYEQVQEVLDQLQARADAGKKAQLLAEPPPVIYIPTADDSHKVFSDYSADAERRLEHDERFPNEPRQIKPGEIVTRTEGGKVQVSGQVAVMAINALLTKVIFDHNPTNEFFVEESFPLDWMYPHLTPVGIIMKINRQPLPELTDEICKRDHASWSRYSERFIGNWITYETPVKDIAEFAERVYLRHDFSGFKGDRGFVRDDQAQKVFSKLRVSIAGVYAWRLGMSGSPTEPQYLAKPGPERDRMLREADLAFKQAFAYCPYSPEAVYRYINLLANPNVGRLEDALIVAETCLKFDPHNGSFISLVDQLRSMKNGPNARAQTQTEIAKLEGELRSNPNDFQKSFDLAARYMQLQQTDRVIQILDAVVKNPQVNMNAIFGAAQAYAQLNNLPKLETALKKLTELGPNEPESWYNLAATQAALKKPTEAMQNARRAVELSDKRKAATPTAHDLREELKKDAHFLALRDLPEYKALISPP